MQIGVVATVSVKAQLLRVMLNKSFFYNPVLIDKISSSLCKEKQNFIVPVWFHVDEVSCWVPPEDVGFSSFSLLAQTLFLFKRLAFWISINMSFCSIFSSSLSISASSLPKDNSSIRINYRQTYSWDRRRSNKSCLTFFFSEIHFSNWIKTYGNLNYLTFIANKITKLLKLYCE